MTNNRVLSQPQEQSKLLFFKISSPKKFAQNKKSFFQKIS